MKPANIFKSFLTLTVTVTLAMLVVGHPAMNVASSVVPKPGYVSGRATTISGTPLPGAVVQVIGFSKAGAKINERAKTEADGSYEVRVPPGSVSRASNAYADVNFNGMTFNLRLHPIETGFENLADTDSGLVRNFVLRLQGLRPEKDLDPKNPDSYYGQHIQIGGKGDDKGFYPDAAITVTLTPQGPLADGSSGRTLTFKRTMKALYSAPNMGKALDDTKVLYDIPLGTYTASASIAKPGGAAQPMNLTAGDSTNPSTSLEIRFEPAMVSGAKLFFLTLHFPN